VGVESARQICIVSGSHVYTDGQIDRQMGMTRSTWLVIMIKNIYTLYGDGNATLWGRKGFMESETLVSASYILSDETNIFILSDESNIPFRTVFSLSVLSDEHSKPFYSIIKNVIFKHRRLFVKNKGNAIVDEGTL